jgi:CDP-6-deoxy-D-xylo-4-hexulose-3-dehydrase
MSRDDLRAKVLGLVREYCRDAFPALDFHPGTTPLLCAGRVFDEEEVVSLVDAALDFWLTTGRYADSFEREFAGLHGAQHAILCNSGSSANLLAVSALTSAKLGERQLHSGDEVITLAAGFPTTVNPVFQNNLVPVFVDVDLATYNANVSQLQQALSPRTRAIILAHTLGNPFDLDAVVAFAKRHGLWLIEDNCDALGSTYKGKITGSFGDLATVSFYPAHHITTGEGGCVLTSDPQLKVIVESFRDWGRDCWCDPGNDNTCGRRYQWQLGSLPAGYDHKYIFSHVGYNLKATDLQAAIGFAQLKKLGKFIEARRRNWHLLLAGLRPLEEFFILPEPTPQSEPSWFGFALTVREGASFSRSRIIDFLANKKIATRLLFGGNLTRQPAYRDRTFRQVSELRNTDVVMERTFWVGVYPGLTAEMISYMVEAFQEFAAQL